MQAPFPTTGNRFLADLQPADRERLRYFITPINLTSGLVVHEAGSAVDSLLLPDGSILSVITLMQDGRGAESCTIGRESGYGFLNALGSRIAFHRIIAQVPGAAFRIPIHAVQEAALASPTLLNLISRHIQGQAGMSEQSAACNALHPVDARLRRWLLLSADRAGSEFLPLTQEFLGFMLGVQRTTVTAAAQALHSAGLIRYSRGRIELLDRAGLEACACECYAVVNERLDELLGSN